MKELLHMYISKTEYKIVGVANHSLFPYKYIDINIINYHLACNIYATSNLYCHICQNFVLPAVLHVHVLHVHVIHVL